MIVAELVGESIGAEDAAGLAIAVLVLVRGEGGDTVFVLEYLVLIGDVVPIV